MSEAERAAIERRTVGFGLPSGGDTTGAALAAGVPVVTRVGARHAERMTYSILKHLTLEQTIAASDDAYVAVAVRLANDTLFRTEVRGAVHAALADPRMTDPVRYGRALEAAFQSAIAATSGLGV